jgi:hypothetical protein
MRGSPSSGRLTLPAHGYVITCKDNSFLQPRWTLFHTWAYVSPPSLHHIIDPCHRARGNKYGENLAPTLTKVSLMDCSMLGQHSGIWLFAQRLTCTKARSIKLRGRTCMSMPMDGQITSVRVCENRESCTRTITCVWPPWSSCWRGDAF